MIFFWSLLVTLLVTNILNFSWHFILHRKGLHFGRVYKPNPRGSVVFSVSQSPERMVVWGFSAQAITAWFRWRLSNEEALRQLQLSEGNSQISISSKSFEMSMKVLTISKPYVHCQYNIIKILVYTFFWKSTCKEPQG
jgi:hypothetical protein